MHRYAFLASLALAAAVLNWPAVATIARF